MPTRRALVTPHLTTRDGNGLGLTNGFSKKVANHCHMVALYTLCYNFVKIHKTLKMTPPMAAGVSDRLWSVEDIAKLVEEREAARKPMDLGELIVG